jgi:mono/diheme cytochrome c family protein
MNRLALNRLALAGIRLAICLAVSPVVFAKPSAVALAAVDKTVSVTLPDSHNIFPPGAGLQIANAQCMICHSAGMVTRQPALNSAEWTAEVNKMRKVYGAPLPEEQVEPLVKYLTTINGKP